MFQNTNGDEDRDQDRDKGIRINSQRGEGRAPQKRGGAGARNGVTPLTHQPTHPHSHWVLYLGGRNILVKNHQQLEVQDKVVIPPKVLPRAATH